MSTIIACRYSTTCSNNTSNASKALGTEIFNYHSQGTATTKRLKQTKWHMHIIAIQTNTIYCTSSGQKTMIYQIINGFHAIQNQLIARMFSLSQPNQRRPRRFNTVRRACTLPVAAGTCAQRAAKNSAKPCTIFKRSKSIEQRSLLLAAACRQMCRFRSKTVPAAQWKR